MTIETDSNREKSGIGCCMYCVISLPRSVASFFPQESHDQFGIPETFSVCGLEVKLARVRDTTAVCGEVFARPNPQATGLRHKCRSESTEG